MLPAYAGLLASMGLTFLLETKYLLPITTGALVIAVGTLRFRARRRRGNGPFYLGFVAALVMIIGKFLLELEPVMWSGLALLIAASVWNTWPKALLPREQEQ